MYLSRMQAPLYARATTRKTLESPRAKPFCSRVAILITLSAPLQLTISVEAAAGPLASTAAPGNLKTHDLLGGTRRAHRLPNFGTRTQPAEAGTRFDNEHSDKELRWQEQMQGFGALQFEVQTDPHGLPPTGGNRRAIVKQTGATLNDSWRMDSTIGEQRIRNLPILGTGYRYSLPDAPLRGMTMRGHNRSTEVNWAVGEKGFMQGNKIKSFETTGNTLTGLGARHSLTRNWRFGTQSWLARDDRKRTSQHSLGSALEYLSSDKNRRHALRAVQDSEQRWGSWLDNEHTFGAWRQRYGAYHFEPKLHWASKPVADDREGMYWRTDYERGRMAWFGGLESERSNVLADPEVAGLVTTFGSLGAKRRLNDVMGIGGSFRAGVERQGPGAPAPDARIRKVKLFVDRDFTIGASQFGAQLFARDSEHRPEESRGLFWDHAWLASDTHKFKTLMGVTHLTRNDRLFVIPATGFKLKYSLSRDFELQAGMKYLWQQTSRIEEDAASHAMLGLSWLFDRHWRVSLNGRWDGEILKEDALHRDLLNRVYLSVAYQPIL
jgi:hypothetical protein